MLFNFLTKMLNILIYFSRIYIDIIKCVNNIFVEHLKGSILDWLNYK